MSWWWEVAAYPPERVDYMVLVCVYVCVYMLCFFCFFVCLWNPDMFSRRSDGTRMGSGDHRLLSKHERRLQEARRFDPFEHGQGGGVHHFFSSLKNLETDFIPLFATMPV